MVKPRAPQPFPTPSCETKKRTKAPTAADVGQQIGEKLRSMFDAVLTEPVPEKFRRLLDELERKSSRD
jgi:hypothetical protein